MRFYTAALIFLLAACAKKNDAATYPACVQIVVDNGSSDYLEIQEYRQHNQTVYLFIADCCDRFNYLYDVNCRQLCAPSGGFSGRGDGSCPDFFQAATFVKTVWKR